MAVATLATRSLTNRRFTAILTVCAIAMSVTLLLGIVGAGFLVGAIPAVRAYRYSLADGMTIRI